MIKEFYQKKTLVSPRRAVAIGRRGLKTRLSRSYLFDRSIRVLLGGPDVTAQMPSPWHRHRKVIRYANAVNARVTVLGGIAQHQLPDRVDLCCEFRRDRPCSSINLDLAMVGRRPFFQFLIFLVLLEIGFGLRRSEQWQSGRSGQ